MKVKGVISLIQRLGDKKCGRGASDMWVLICKGATPQEALESLSSDWVQYELPNDCKLSEIRIAVSSRAMSVVVFERNIWRLNVHKLRSEFEAHVKELDFIYWGDMVPR